MRRRVLAAGGGALATATVLAIVLAASPVRPAGLLLALALLVVIIPWSTGAGTRAGLRLAGQDDEDTAGRLAAVTAPILVLTVVFMANLAAGTSGQGIQQLVSLVVGSVTAAMFAARFSGAVARLLEERADS